ncbi:MAG: alpha/beta hydrolase domain-containing protein [Acidimicrobiales bacterium]
MLVAFLATVTVFTSLYVMAPAASGAAGPGNASVPVPSVQGPIEPSSQISFLGSTLFPLSSVGYEQSEYFLSGTADSYTSRKPLSKNGRWHVSVATRAAYKTRIVVYRPVNPKHFDGTVVVEWLNVTGGVDAGAAWLQSHIQMIRNGMAYVGVDAQAGGINGETGSIASSAEPGGGGLKGSDPTRYGTLDHPGDSYSYSIFEQAGNAVHAEARTILGGLAPRHVLALGESQSAFRMTTYIDALQPASPGIYSAYFVYSRGGNSAALSESPQKTINTPTPTLIRTDLHVPVFLFETETDLLGLNYVVARQPATKEIREWEVAGVAHDDSYGLLYSRSDGGGGVADTEAFDSMLHPSADPIPGIVSCSKPINGGSQTYELRAAMVAVNRWMTSGKAPRQSPRLEVAKGGKHFVTNAQGNALGGIRTPQVVAPVATLSGLGQPGIQAPSQPSATATSLSAGAICSIFGTTTAFSTARLTALYPTHADFLKKWDAATAALVRQGYLLGPDARTLNRVAAQSTVGG